MGAGLTSIIIPVYNQLDVTKICIDNLKEYTGLPHELILVNNGSDARTTRFLKSVPKATVISFRKNIGYTKATNLGIRKAMGRNIVLFNNDIVPTFNWLENMLRCLNSNKKIGMVGPKTNEGPRQQRVKTQLNTVKEIQRFARNFNRPSNPKKWYAVDWLSGFCLLIRGELLKKIGLLDKRFRSGLFTDNDYCIRARKAGYEIFCAGDTYVHHFGSKTFNRDRADKKRALSRDRHKLLKKWGLKK